MSLDVHITDPATGRKAVVVDGTDPHALVVATRPLKTFVNVSLPFADPETGSIDMNVNAAAGAGTDLVYAENVEWTTSAITGTWDFASGTVAHGGAVSIDATSATKNSVAQLAKGSGLDLTVSDRFLGWIYITNWIGGGGVEVYGWDTGTGTQVGVAADLSDYVTEGSQNQWLQFSIPLADLGLAGETIDAIRISPTENNLDFYLDDLGFYAASSDAPVRFRVAPALTTWLHIHNLTITIADAHDGTYADLTMPEISYDKVLGHAKLNPGIVWQRRILGDVDVAFQMRQIADLLQFPNASLQSAISDGVNTMVSVTINFTHPITLCGECDDWLDLIIQEDLSSFKFFRVFAGGRIEYR